MADEPVSALDVSVGAQVLVLLRELQREFGLTYVFISHSLPVVAQLATRIAVMHAGRFVEIGAAEQSASSPTHEYTRELLAAVRPSSYDSGKVFRPRQGQGESLSPTPENDRSPQNSLKAAFCGTELYINPRRMQFAAISISKAQGDSMSTTPASTAPIDDQPSSGAFGRLAGAIVSPKRTFAEIARRPTWVLPFFTLCLLSIVGWHRSSAEDRLAQFL